MTHRAGLAGNSDTKAIDDTDALATLTVLADEDGRIAIQLGEQPMHRDVIVRSAAPLTDRTRWVVFLNAEGRELCVVRDPRRLSIEAQAVVKAALERHYASAQVTAVLSLRTEGEACFFQVVTLHGRREFVANLHEGLRCLDDRRLLFQDVNGNRFEVEDLDRLDRRSRALLEKVV